MKTCPKCGKELVDLEEECSCGYSFWNDFTNDDKQTIYLRKIKNILSFFLWITIIGLGIYVIKLFLLLK